MTRRIKMRKKQNKTGQHTIITETVTQQTRKFPNWNIQGRMDSRFIG